jgi:methyl-accepting chemotaxis protein
VVASPDAEIEGGPAQRVGIGTRESLDFETDAVHQTEPYVVDGKEYISFISSVPNRDDRAVVLTANLDTVAEHVFQSPFDGGFTQVAWHASDRGVADQAPVEGGPTERYLVQYAPVNGGEWVLMFHVPASEAFYPGNTVQQDIFIIIGLFLAGLGAVGVVLHRYTVRPVTRLEDHVATLRDGDLDATADSGLHDEIGRLHGGVESLRRIIKRRIEDAEAATAEAREASREAESAKEDAVATQAEALGEHLEQKASEFGVTMAACTDDDLTERLDPDSRSAAMTEVAEAFNGMMDEIEETVVRVQAFSEDVAAMS